MVDRASSRKKDTVLYVVSSGVLREGRVRCREEGTRLDVGHSAVLKQHRRRVHHERRWIGVLRLGRCFVYLGSVGHKRRIRRNEMS